MTRLQFYHLENSAESTDTLRSGPAVKTSSSSTSTSQNLSSTSSSPAAERSDNPAQENWNNSPKIQKHNKKKVFPGWLQEFVEILQKCACTRTHLSRLSFGTSYESGIQEAQSLHTLPKRPKLKSMLADQNDKGPLAEEALAKQYLEQKSLVIL